MPIPSEDLLRATYVGRHELWGIKTVVQRTGLSRATVYRYTMKGILPPRRRVGPGRVAWLASEMIAWIESRPEVDRPRKTS
jgi:prophage regulatory protein